MLHPLRRTQEFEATLHERYDLPSTRVVAFALAGTLAAGAVAAVVEQPPPHKVPHPTATYNAAPRAPSLEEVIAPLRAQLIRDIRLKQVRASVPPRLNSAALLQTRGNPVAANQLLIKEAVPPMTIDVVRATAKSLHLGLPRRAERQVQVQVRNWEHATPTAALKVVVHPEEVAKDIMSNVDAASEAATRQRIVAIARSYLGVAETIPNRGPVIDRFTGNQPIAWCAAMASFVYNQAGVPLSGGQTVDKRYPDYRIVRTLINPHSPEVTSMQSAFQTQGYEFRAPDRLPEPGDVLMMRRKDGGHTMIAERMVDATHVLAIGGNTGNAVAERVVDLAAPDFVAAGSLFAK